MRPYIVCAVLVATLGCVESIAPSETTYTVTYRLTKTPVASGLVCDSVRYENADGQVITQVNPSFPWTASFGAPKGNFIHAIAWIQASGGGQSAKLKVTWSAPRGISGADSLVGTTTAPGDFTLNLMRRQL